MILLRSARVYGQGGRAANRIVPWSGIANVAVTVLSSTRYCGAYFVVAEPSSTIRRFVVSGLLDPESAISEAEGLRFTGARPPTHMNAATNP